MCIRDRYSDEYKGSVGICPARLESEEEKRVIETALEAYNLAGCRDYARVDIRLSRDGIPYVLEVNANPDISIGAGFVRSAEAYGWNHEELIRQIALFALERTKTDSGSASKGIAPAGDIGHHERLQELLCRRGSVREGTLYDIHTGADG